MKDLINCPLGQHPIMLAFFFGASALATRTASTLRRGGEVMPRPKRLRV